jgi:hypothetical protein
MVEYQQVVISDWNRTPVVQILTWFTLITSVLAFCAHAGIKFYVYRALTLESWFVLAALVSQKLQKSTCTDVRQVFCTSQSIAVTMQAQYGFGKPMRTLSDSHVALSLEAVKSGSIDNDIERIRRDDPHDPLLRLLETRRSGIRTPLDPV